MSLSERLKEFGEDLVEKAKLGKLDDALCREKEIDRVVEILARRKKNNVLLLGDPGVGKTSIVEGIAKRIAAEKTNNILDKKIIYSLDYHFLISGTMYRGQLEERATNLIKEIKANKNIILFIDEIHSIFSNKMGASSSSDLNNFLKPYLSSGDVQIIGITTYDEYRSSIGKDKALARRFQIVTIKPTSKDETLTILKSVYKEYEAHHNVKYDTTILEECVDLAKKYVFDRQLPDSAIDILDEAGSIVSLHNKNYQPDGKKIKNLIQKLDKLEREKKRKIKSEDFENILDFKKRLDDLKYELEIEQEKWYKSNTDKIPTVRLDDIHTTVSKMTGIGVDHFTMTYLKKIDNLKINLENNVFGQNAAIEELIKVLRRKVIDITDFKKPSSILAVGASGTGKTTMAKIISETIFGTSKKLIRLDMSEFSDGNSLSKLIGSPPGYIGYDDGGILTEEVKKHPHSVVLFDEVEKANPEIFNILLQILDEGHVKDSLGNLINFKHTIIIMTSNLGSNAINNVGFKRDDKVVSEYINKEINKFFKIEFLNRLDKILYFNQLNQQDISNIYEYELAKIKTKFEKHNIILNISTDLKDHIIEVGYDIKFGARFMRRAIYENIVDRVLDYMINNKKFDKMTVLNINKIEIK